MSYLILNHGTNETALAFLQPLRIPHSCTSIPFLLITPFNPPPFSFFSPPNHISELANSVTTLRSPAAPKRQNAHNKMTISITIQPTSICAEFTLWLAPNSLPIVPLQTANP